jgi:hypothetical protein
VADRSDEVSPKKRINTRSFTRTKLFDIWTTESISKVKGLRSNHEEGSEVVRASFRNGTGASDVVVCWMDAQGLPQRHTPPSDADGNAQDVACGSIVCFAVCKDLEKSKQENTTDMILAAYRPRVPTKEPQIVSLVESNKVPVEGASAPMYTVQVKSVPRADHVALDNVETKVE